jgi:xanthine/CO dehydrogenase XdhC/CoxF family maturation factor
MIGSRKKRDAVYEDLKKQGITEESLGRVKNPIGLDIGAETPEEIAISILAEIIAVRAGRREAMESAGETAKEETSVSDKSDGARVLSL